MMESKVRRVDVVNFYAFIVQNYTQFALKIVIFVFKFVQILQEFSYYIKMYFSWVLSHSCTVSFPSFYFFHTHPRHCQLSVIFITMAVPQPQQITQNRAFQNPQSQQHAPDLLRPPHLD
jgi:hypothetical protein